MGFGEEGLGVAFADFQVPVFKEKGKLAKECIRGERGGMVAAY